MRVKISSLICFCFVFTIFPEENPSVFIKNEIIEISSEGIAFLGSGMTEDDAKTFAIKDAKRNALEQAGTYLESHTEVLNYKLVKDEIITYTGSLLETQIISSESTLINKRFAIKVLIKASIDSKILKERIEKIFTDNLLKIQLEEERKRNDALLKKVKELQEKDGTKKDVKNIINLLSAKDLVVEGRKALRNEDFKSAITLFDKARNIDARLIIAHRGLGISYMKLKNYDQAFKVFNNSILINSDSAMAYAYRGKHYYEVLANCLHYTMGYEILDEETLEPIRESEHIEPDPALDHYLSAYNDYMKAIEIEPLNKIPYLYLCSLYEENNQLQDALEYINIAIKKIPNDPYLLKRRGDFLLKLNRFNEAFVDHENALNIDSTKSFYYIFGWEAKADEYVRNENCLEAIKFYDKALLLQKNKQGLWLYVKRGDAYFELGKFDKAFKDYNQAIRLDSTDYFGYKCRGDQYYELKQYKKALADFNKVISLNPKEGYKYRGDFYLNLDNYEKAFNDHKKAIELDTTNNESKISLKKEISRDWQFKANYKPMYKCSDEEYNKALNLFSKAIFFDSSEVSNFLQRGSIYSKLKKYNLAFKDFNVAIGKAPDDGEPYSDRANLYSELERYEQAIQDYCKSIELIEANKATNNKKNLFHKYWGRGLTYIDIKQYELALNDYKKAIELSLHPNLSSYLYFQIGNIIQLTSDASKIEKAIESYNKAIAINPEYSEAYLNRGLCYASLGKDQDAVYDLNEFVKFEKNSNLAKEARDFIIKLGYTPRY